ATWSGPRPPGVSDDQVAAADAMAVWFDEMVTTAQSKGANCAAMGEALRAVASRGKPLIARSTEIEKQLAKDAAASKWMEQYAMKKMDLARLMKALGGCATDKGVQDALS